MNLRKAGGTAAQAALQASSYRGMHTTPRRDSLMVKRWLKRASEPSRAKQGTQTPGKILQHSKGAPSILTEGLRPSDSPTRALARRLTARSGRAARSRRCLQRRSL